MRHFLFLILSCFLVLLLFGGPASAEGKPVVVHFVVLPENLPDGSSAESAFKTFQAEMIMLAGGFSELGPSQGGSLHPGGVVPKDNRAYLVSAKKDICDDIKIVVQRIFKIKKVFILSWQGNMVR